MAFYNNSLADLIVMALRLPLQDYVGGTATGGTTGTLLDSSRYERDDYFNNMNPTAWIRVVSTTDSQAPKGEERRITDWAQSSGTFSVAPTFSVTPGAGDTYAVLSKFGWAEIRDAINVAIESVAKTALVPRVDETLTFQTDSNGNMETEYALPAGFTIIYRVSQVNDYGEYPYVVPPLDYRILRTSTPRIKFERFPKNMMATDTFYGGLWIENQASDGKNMRIEGFERQARLVNDDDRCYINPNYLIYKAAEMLFSARIVNTASEYDAARVKAETCRDIANTFIADTITRMPPDSKKVEF